MMLEFVMMMEKGDSKTDANDCALVFCFEFFSFNYQVPVKMSPVVENSQHSDDDESPGKGKCKQTDRHFLKLVKAFWIR